MNYKLYRFFKEYFYLSSYQKKALLFLIVIFILVSLLSYNVHKLSGTSKSTDTTVFKQYEVFLKQLKKKPDKPYYNRLDRYILKRYDTIKLFAFNPNTASYEDFLKLGLTPKQARTILNYRNRGGKFRIKDDFRKVYGIRYMQYKILRPYIQLPDSLTPKHSHRKEQSAEKNPVYFAFDPNTISQDSLMLLGFSERQAQSIIKARQKGWHFRIKKDFGKLYVVSEEKFRKLEPYILLPDSVEYKKHNISTIKPIEINSATAEDFVRVLRIKKYMAERIIKYRKLLGGFYTPDQLAEVYGFPVQKLKSARKYLMVDTSKIHRINIRTADFRTLVRHPYIDGGLARWILDNRGRRKFQSLDYLRHYDGLEEYQLRDLKHYLTLE